MTEQRYS